MKNLIGLIILVMIVAGCSFLKKKEEPKPTNPTVSNTATKTETTESKTETTTNDDKSTSGLTLEKFNQIQNGMKYEEVVKILGGNGTETSSFSSGSLKTVSYKWEGEKYARITATFRNGELTSKIQSGLKSGSNTPKADLTMAKYNQIQNGMSYEEAVKIIGSEGTQSSSSNFGKIKVASYKWEGEKYAKMFATFKDNKLTSKSQANVK